MSKRRMEASSLLASIRERAFCVLHSLLSCRQKDWGGAARVHISYSVSRFNHTTYYITHQNMDSCRFALQQWARTGYSMAVALDLLASDQAVVAKRLSITPHELPVGPPDPAPPGARPRG